MEFLLIDILLIPIGWIAMIAKHKDRDKRRKTLQHDYNGKYSNAARDMISSVLLIGFGIMIFALILMALYAAIFSDVSNLN